ncbi:hypothetical protein AHFPHNDE_02495 [Pseudomonas sp. MM227]|jgi:hypothetical protein|uniref:Uncharacterized protein n=1 Tax=Pseudomonas baltica TaxID=2762576 RepID=A0A7X1G208_9PSED|nr:MULTISPECIES: hypothetical protein [Pseudomonas]RZA13662.1 MAG: hypothetical protein EOP02_27965 [Pseudomonadota bacterium]MBC2676826.1 hypothetical protein [Pseudomonas baltica]MBD8474665.1 hypothetical protein [Pseudomonas sp. CFBP 8773]MBD8594858.1 hypothetical protein [Pseudomonas sp. CFBP 8758]MBD8602883.1 hypothetical protein [Pseudomonas sp. CFBP 8771]
MTEDQANYKRLLTLIESAQWQAFGSEDGFALRALLLVGYVVTTVTPDSRTRLALTVRGTRYLEELRSEV